MAITSYSDLYAQIDWQYGGSRKLLQTVYGTGKYSYNDGKYTGSYTVTQTDLLQARTILVNLSAITVSSESDAGGTSGQTTKTITFDMNGGSEGPTPTYWMNRNSYAYDTNNYNYPIFGVTSGQYTTGWWGLKAPIKVVNENKYAITLNANGGSVESTTVYSKVSVSYAFKYWYSSGDNCKYGPSSGESGRNAYPTADTGRFYSVDRDTTFTAYWDDTKIYGQQYPAVLPTPTLAGYDFAGWFTAASGGTQRALEYTPTSNETLYAHWTAKTYTVTYDANGGTGAPSSTTITYNAKTPISTTKPTRTGYTFTGWKYDGSSTILQPGAAWPDGWMGATIRAQWSANSLTFSNETKSTAFSTSAQTMTVGAASNGTGTYTYSLGSSSNAAFSFNTSTRVLTLKASSSVGSYVAYITAKDSNSNVTSTKTITWTVTKASGSVTTAPTAKSLTYTGSAQALINAGSTSTGTMQYKLAGGSYSTAIPTGTTAQVYKVYYYSKGDANHNDSSEAGPISITIASKQITVTAPTIVSSDLEYNGSAKQLINAGSAVGATLYYYATTSSTVPTFSASTWVTSVTAAAACGIDAGTYNLYYYAYRTDNNYSGGNTVVSLGAKEIINSNIVAIPTLSVSSFTYSGNEYTINLTAPFGTVLSGVTSATNVGEYTAVLTCEDEKTFTDGTTSKSYTWTITKANTAAASVRDSVWTGVTQDVRQDNVGVIWSGDYYITAPGDYVAIATPDSNHTWPNGTSDTKNLSWTMDKATITGIIVTPCNDTYDANNHSAWILSNRLSSVKIEAGLTSDYGTIIESSSAPSTKYRLYTSIDACDEITIYYRVSKDQNYYPYEGTTTFKINKANQIPTINSTLAEDNSDFKLEALAQYGDYYLGYSDKDNTDINNITWLPANTTLNIDDAGEYKVWYKVDSTDNNYNGIEPTAYQTVLIIESAQGRVLINGEWKKGKVYVFTNGEWKKTKPYVMHNNAWIKTK